ncbi:MAG: hypothetical protein MJ252_29635 [archaeon]|nr:hypothetical protein [archaeon]
MGPNPQSPIPTYLLILIYFYILLSIIFIKIFLINKLNNICNKLSNDIKI